MSTPSFERKTLPNGQPNPKYIDLCDEDQPIAGQKFACISFISPEKILKKRELYLFEKFVQQWDMSKSMGKFFDFIHFLSYKYNLNVEDVIKDLNEFIREEEPKLKQEAAIEDDYHIYINKNEDKLNEEFNKKHAFQTSVRGLKLRGVFPTEEEAENRCKKLREFDPNHDIFVGPVGVWMPWDPDAYKTGRVEFMEEELNRLHKEKMKNEEKAKQEFEQRIKETKKKAIEDNIKLAEKSGNVLTQTLDENGNLVGVMETVDFDSREAAETDTTKIREELLKESIELANRLKEQDQESSPSPAQESNEKNRE
jgi:hypothetical protein